MVLTLPTVAAAWVVSPRDQLRPAAAVAAVLLGWLVALSMLLLAATLQLLWRGDGRHYPADTLLLPAGTPGRGKLVAAVETLAALAGRLGLGRRPRSHAATDRAVVPFDGEGEPPGLLWAGYKTQDGRWLEGHLTSAVFCALTVLLYAIGYKLLHPDAGPFNDFPSLGYVLFILLFFGWLLPGFAFFLDRYRVPPSLVLVALSYLLSTSLSYLVPATDHTWSAQAAAVGHDGEAEPAAGEVERVTGAVCPRSQQAAASRRPEVYVAASGGGITASVWTARVLAGLQCEAGEGFTSSLELISSVSGGSVGTLHYVDRWQDGRPPPPAALDELVDASGASSLDAIAWGLAYPDLWRLAGFPLYLIDPKVDRGWALERAWRDALDHRRAALSAWRGEVAAGRLPGVVFNATVAESGEPFRFSSYELPALGGQDFGVRFPRGDVDVVTAARLSASFPWVSPLARARGDGADGFMLHLGDGGYYDNFGVATLADLMSHRLDADDAREDAATEGEVVPQAFADDGVLFVEIRASPLEAAEPEPLSGWLAAGVGPVSTLLATRNAGQRLRNGLELDEVVKRLRRDCVPVVRASIELEYAAPLSWKLTAEERRRIVGAWDPKDRELAAELDKVRCAFGYASGADCADLFSVHEDCGGAGVEAAEAADRTGGAVMRAQAP
jgi:hypothetical protein